MTMTTQYRQAPELLSAGARIATALAVVTCVAATWLATEHESHRAVQVASTAITGPVYVTLPRVEIVAKRQHTEVVGEL
jgi:hypothetical protein